MTGELVKDTEKLVANNAPSGVQLIDLGLPSGTLWTDRNLGADAPEKTGDYYCFGETVPFTEDSPKYVYDEINGNIAGTDRDAATVNLGKNYRMPTFDQIKELLDECKWKWTKQNGVNGMKVTGPNGNGNTNQTVYVGSGIPATGYAYQASTTALEPTYRTRGYIIIIAAKVDLQLPNIIICGMHRTIQRITLLQQRKRLYTIRALQASACRQVISAIICVMAIAER